MKNLKYLFICFLFTANVKAQLVFTAANTNPVAGDSYSEYGADTTGINPGSAGANQTWNFSNLNIGTTYHSHFYVIPVPTFTGCSNVLASANLLDSISGEYLLCSNDSLKMIGTNSSSNMYNNFKLLLKYPFYYNWSCNNSFSDCFVYGYKITNTYDGYGTLILPGGITYTNAARIHSFEDDSTGYIDNPPESFVNRIHTYKW